MCKLPCHLQGTGVQAGMQPDAADDVVPPCPAARCVWCANRCAFSTARADFGLSINEGQSTPRSMEIGTPGYCGALPVMGLIETLPSPLTLQARRRGVIQAIVDLTPNVMSRKLGACPGQA